MTAQVVEVVVQGPLWPSLLSVLDDFTVETDADGRTTIVGSVADQPHLVGLLDMFGSLNVDIISVNPRPEVAS